MEREEAIEVIKKNWPDSSFTMLREALETLIPELKESEDERIRKEIISAIKEDWPGHKDWIIWLESQGETSPVLSNSSNIGKVEQKPAWSEEDEERLQSCLNILQAKGLMGVTDTINSKWLKELKDRVQPKQEWSEEDEKMIDAIYSCVDSHYDGLAKDALLIWLKSLRPQKQWRPSEEQKLAVETAINVIGKNTLSGKHLIDLLGQIKAL